jgi:hypothetical protein
MNDDVEKTLKSLLRTQKWNSSFLGRATRWVMFKLGFSRCQFCIYCHFDGQPYRSVREDVILRDGECQWSKESASSRLNWEDITSFHRCPGFVQVLYNIKDYAIDPEEVRKIRNRRVSHLVTIAGWVVAVIIAAVAAWLKNAK